jgi:Chaperone of endosialidase
MKPRLNYHLLAALLFVAFSAEVRAQNSSFTYQGQLTENGTAGNNTGVWANFSDRRLKERIEPMQSGSLDQLLKLEGATYDYVRPDLREGYDGLRRGWIAQQAEEVFPGWVSEALDGMKMVTPVGFNALTVEALPELRAEKDTAIQGLNQKVEQKNAEIAELKARLASLEKTVRNLAAKGN